MGSIIMEFDQINKIVIFFIIITVLYSNFRVISLFLASKVKTCNSCVCCVCIFFLVLPEFTFQCDSVTGMIS